VCETPQQRAGAFRNETCAARLGRSRQRHSRSLALQAGAKINLPWIAPGDLLYLQAAYARGALDYTISGNWVFGGATGSQGGFGGTLGRFAINTVDGVVDQFGETNLSRSWSVVAAFLHYWTPQLRSGFAVGYSNVEYPNANTLFVGGVIPGTVLNPAPGAPHFAFGDEWEQRVERLKADLEAQREQPLDLPTLPLRGNGLAREH
jgi:hypothetical protein